MKAYVSDIKRFSVHDGDGIRTTIFFKGCPLKCIWCHNPESIAAKPQIAYFKNKCINCGHCQDVCSNNAHTIKEGLHSFNFDLCVACGKCVDNCLGAAMVYYGKEYSTDELLEIILKDKDFYDNSNGGVTLSGGECLIHTEFCLELLKKIKAHNIHVAIDTCGYIDSNVFEKIKPYVDLFIYDIKAIDEDLHIKCTGKSNKLILKNIKIIDGYNIPIYVRIPFVPGFNDKEIDKIAKFLKPLKNIDRVEVLPFHNYSASRYEALNMQNTLPNIIPSDNDIKEAITKF